MATTTIPWGDGSGDNIYLTYSSASGDQIVQVSSDANTGSSRSKVVTFTSGVGGITKLLTINQEAGVATIPYIRGGADGSYIDTGITPDETTKVIVWARNLNPTCGWFFGSRIALQNSQLGLFLPATNPGAIRCIYYTNVNYDANDQFANLSGYHKYELYQGVLKVDDVEQASGSTGTFSCPHNLYLLGMNTAGTLASPTLPIDICACKIYKNGALVRDFTAVDSPSVGLYDAVSDTVFTNAGTGSFTYGTFNPNAYTPLEYISCTNKQWFDSGVYGTTSLGVISKFRIVGTSITYPSLFGTYTSGTANTYFLLQFGNANYPNRYANLYINTTSAQAIYNTNNPRLTNRNLVFVKDSSSARLYENGSGIGTSQSFSGSFTTPDTIAVCGHKQKGSAVSSGFFNGYMYYISFGSQRNFVPAKVNDVAGMYDTYNDVFYQSATSTAFTAGPEL